MVRYFFSQCVPLRGLGCSQGASAHFAFSYLKSCDLRLDDNFALPLHHTGNQRPIFPPLGAVFPGCSSAHDQHLCFVPLYCNAANPWGQGWVDAEQAPFPLALQAVFDNVALGETMFG